MSVLYIFAAVDCMTRWISVRDRFVRVLKACKMSLGENDSIYTALWPKFRELDEMEFYLPYTKTYQ